MSARSFPLFAAEVLPREFASPKIPARLATQWEADVVATAVSETPTVRGWILPPEGTQIRGLRAINTHQIAVAKRKQTRLDVYVQYPQHPDSLQCGFIIEPKLQPGWNEFELQYKDQHRHWHSYCRIHIKLPRLWKLRRPRCIAIPTDHENWSVQHGDAQPAELQAMAKFLPRFPGKPPLLSVLMPTYNTPIRWLHRAIESIQQQVYPHWELCIADDLSDDAAVRRLLRDYAAKDPRIKVKLLNQRGHICHSSNAALELCQGDFTVLFDHDDELPPHALFHIASEAAHCREANIIFSDEDKIDIHGIRSDPYFKSGWNYELLLSENCVSHVGAFRTSLLREIGGFRPGYEGSQDWDLALRSLERCSPSQVRHIPRVLYHWRTLATSTASGSHAKPYARQAGQRAVSDHLQRTSPGAELQPLNELQWRILWKMPDPKPLASIVVCIDHLTELTLSNLEHCMANTGYAPFELILVSTNDQGDFSQISGRYGNFRHLQTADDLSPVSRLNLAVSAASGEVLIFQHHLLEILQTDWLEELVRQVSRPAVGAVAASVISHSNLLHHGGLALHPSDPVIQFVNRSLPMNARTAGGPSDAVREVAAVPDACFAVRRKAFVEAGSFDPAFTSTLAATVDLCSKMSRQGLRHLITPFSMLRLSATRHDSVDQDTPLSPSDTSLLAKHWSAQFRDPFFNPNLSVVSSIPFAAAPSIQWPWQDQSQD